MQSIKPLYLSGSDCTRVLTTSIARFRTCSSNYHCFLPAKYVEHQATIPADPPAKMTLGPVNS